MPIRLFFLVTVSLLCAIAAGAPALGKGGKKHAPAVKKTVNLKPGGLNGSVTDDVSALVDQSNDANALKGKAEVVDSPLSASQTYEEGMAAIEKKDYAGAANLLKQAGAHFGPGSEKDRAECLYFEAGCRQMLGQKTEAANLYRCALDLIEKYDAKSPYRKLAMEQLCELTYTKLRSEKQRKLEAVAVKRAQILVDQNITLEGGVEKTAPAGSMGRNALAGSIERPALAGMIEVNKKFIPAIIHKGFFQMTCLETAELGSNATNAHYRWFPLQAYGKPAALGIAVEYNDPFIKIKVNRKYYTVRVSLPNMRQGALRKILLITNKEKICALDLESYETWLLQMKRQKDGSVGAFSWKKLTHIKNRLTN